MFKTMSDLWKRVTGLPGPSTSAQEGIMHWRKGGEVIVRIPTGDGKVMELYGDVQDISLEIQKDTTPVHDLWGNHQESLERGSRTTFTIRGIAREQHVVDPPKEKVIKPSRWSDIMDEDF